MSSHPDADAFIRAVLREPADATTRLVFADWLEETDAIPDRAWAFYLRLWAEAERLPVGSRERKLLEVEADTHAQHITARPVIPPQVFIKHHRALVALLPTSHLTIHLADHEIPRPIIELMPESVARENIVLPLAIQGRTLLVVMDYPDIRDTVQKLEFIFDKEVVTARGEVDDIRAAIDRHYGLTETESVDSPHYILPIEFDIRPGAPAGYGNDALSVVRLVNLILGGARSRGADRVMISPLAGPGLRYRTEDEWSECEPLPPRSLRPIAARIARMVDDVYGYERSGGVSGRFLCHLGTDRFLVRASIEPLDEGPAVQLDLAADDTLDFP